MRQVGVHMTYKRPLADSWRPSMYDSPIPPSGAMHHLDAAGMIPRECVSDLASAIRGSVVDHQHANVRLAQQLADEDGQILPFVESRHDDERRGRRHRRPSKRSDEICSETRPTRKMTTLSTINSTDEFVTCDCVTIVQRA